MLLAFICSFAYGNYDQDGNPKEPEEGNTESIDSNVVDESISEDRSISEQSENLVVEEIPRQETTEEKSMTNLSKYNYLFYFIYKYKYENRTEAGEISEISLD